MNQPLVSIGVPVYNGAKYLQECIQSIINQTYKNWECVVVDNCSTDDTNSIVREFQETEKRIRLVENKTFVDQTTNWNISFSNSNPDALYFKILCADDWIFPEYLERMVKEMEEHVPAGLCSSYRLDETTIHCDGLDIYKGNFRNGKEILKNQLMNKIDVTGSVSTVLYRVSDLKKLDYCPEIFRPGIYHIDTVLAYDLLYVSDLCFVFQVLSFTRRHNETYTSTISIKFHTYHYFREMVLRKFKFMHDELNNEYQRIRLKYAYFIVKKWMCRDTDCIKWHKKYLTRKFSFGEYVKGFLYYNVLSRFITKLLNR
jgi:glycosyltransferase involved in cell wall biosynthesis